MNAWEWPEGTRWQRWALIAGAVGAALCLVGLIFDREQLFRSYLFAYVTWLGLALGSLAIWMIHVLTGGEWGWVIRRILEAASRTLPVMALLFVPIALGLPRIYFWADGHELHGGKEHYLNVPFFLARTATYFVIWNVILFLLCRSSAALDRAQDPASEDRARQIAGPGLAIFGLTFTFAAIDWVMSLEPEWYSTIFGAVMGTSHLLPALALALLVASRLMTQPALARVATPEVWNDLGNLLLAFVMLWTYMAFSQYLLIWSGNLPEEIVWYLHRTEGGWHWLPIALGLLYFAAPFLLLLPRERKRDPARLTSVLLLLLAMHVVYQYWLIVPAFSPGRFRVHWLDLGAWLAVGGVWASLFVRELQARPLVALHRPEVVEEATAHV